MTVIKTKLCYQSEEQEKFEKLGIESKNKLEYPESDFIFNLKDVSGIDKPTKDDPTRFVIFLKGAGGLLIKHDYKQLKEQWENQFR